MGATDESCLLAGLSCLPWQPSRQRIADWRWGQERRPQPAQGKE